MSKEKWKPVHDPYYAPIFEVSNYGNLRSKTRSFTNAIGRSHTRQGKALKSTLDKGGYSYVHLSFKGKDKVFWIHVLVAHAFCGTPPRLNTKTKRYICVRHRDGKQANNHYKNLRWGTYAKNNDDKRGHGKKTLYAPGKTKLSVIQVVEIRKLR